MTNEINLRTNKSEYNSGEDIYGVVYLRINTPTRGRGVRIRFKGYEKFRYEDKTDAENEICYSDHRDYISLNEILHQSDGPLSMCITYYPFKIQLPIEIPGTFHARHESEEKRWDARVEYILEAEVIDASKTLATVQYVSVRQSLQRELKVHDMPAAILAKYEGSSFFRLFSATIDVTARLQDHIHRTGENAKLRVIITNNSNVIVQSIKLQLRRSIYLTCSQTTLDVQVQENVGQEQSIEMVRFPKGFDNMQIPLRDTNNRPICPSVRGQHVNCDYEVLVTINLNNGDKFDLIVPISVIVAEKNKQWDTWIQPGWITNDSSSIQVIEDSVLRVPENIMSSEPFSTLPGFQPL